MKTLSFLLGATVLLAAAAATSTRAVSHEVTPENIKDQPYDFSVTFKDTGDAKDFEIRVGGKSGRAFLGAGENGSLLLSPCGKKKVHTPPVTIVKSEDGVKYTFRISNRDLDRSIAVFTYEVPSTGDYYQLNLEDFLPHEQTEEKPATPHEPKGQPKIDIRFRDAVESSN